MGSKQRDPDDPHKQRDRDNPYNYVSVPDPRPILASDALPDSRTRTIEEYLVEEPNEYGGRTTRKDVYQKAGYEMSLFSYTIVVYDNHKNWVSRAVYDHQDRLQQMTTSSRYT
ncbi:hypothetical protein R1flu_001199 [Riccia fluitans]|uniref:Uncharacterized protein n=1 Tax=Riccia fluitans TaxID=41844 RepID=A0ABD1Y3L3_9MARC